MSFAFYHFYKIFFFKLVLKWLESFTVCLDTTKITLISKIQITIYVMNIFSLKPNFYPLIWCNLQANRTNNTFPNCVWPFRRPQGGFPGPRSCSGLLAGRSRLQPILLASAALPRLLCGFDNAINAEDIPDTLAFNLQGSWTVSINCFWSYTRFTEHCLKIHAVRCSINY